MLTHFSPQLRYRPMILEIDTTKPGSASNTFILPLRSGYRYCFVVEWGDGSVEKIASDVSPTHVYPASGVYRIKIHGAGYGMAFQVLFFSGTGDAAKLLAIHDFGDVAFTSVASMFNGCSNLTSISRGKLAALGSMSAMFTACSSFNQSLENLNMSSTFNINSMLFGCTSFNQPIEYLDTSNVTNAGGFLGSCTNFNQPIESLLGSGKIISANSMLRDCSSFKQSMVGFNISALTTGSLMLSGTDINDIGTTTRYDALLNSWAGQNFQPNVPFHGGNAKYSAAASAARDTLVAAGWTITDGGLQT